MGDGNRAFGHHFRRFANGNVPTPVTADQARHVIEIIEAAYLAAATGQAQVLTTTF